MQAPLLFVQGGNVYPGGSLNLAGYYGGYYWSSVGRSSSFAYDLFFGSGFFYPSHYFNRYLGLSVRCVALGSHTHCKISMKRIVLVF